MTTTLSPSNEPSNRTLRFLRLLRVTTPFVAIVAPHVALGESTREPFFVEVLPGGAGLGFYDAAFFPSYPLELGAGYHVSGHHEGFVVGLAQRFDLFYDGGVGGASLARIGWDFAIPISEMELVVAPFVGGGPLYDLRGGFVGGTVGGGIETRLFPVAASGDGPPSLAEGVFIVAKPIAVDYAAIATISGAVLSFQAGAGLAL
jgi:hypothetical protein